MKLFDIRKFKAGAVVTRVYPTPPEYGRDHSYIGTKLQIISIGDKIVLKRLEVWNESVIKLPMNAYRYGWRPYILCWKKKVSLADYRETILQISLQKMYIGFQMDKYRGVNSDKFGELLSIYRLLKERLG